MKTFETAAAPHLPNPHSVQRMMLQVLLALLPGVAAQAWFFGAGVLVQITLAIVFASAVESIFLRLRGAPQLPQLVDGSAALTGALFALCIPPLAPWWVCAVAMLAGVGFGKHLYGGLGYNLFNPAMVGYAVVLICFPLELSQWFLPRGLGGLPPGLLESAQAIFGGDLPSRWDSIAQATPLDTLRQLGQQSALTLGEIRGDPLFGSVAGHGWEWIAAAHALGGGYLLWRRIMGWQVPVAMIGSVVLLSLPFWLFEPDLHPSPLQHVFSGAIVIGAFFIATDPVSGCASPRGRLLFGAGVGMLTLVIRRWGGYPDGVAFAVLLMNCAAPWIDLHTRPRIHGEARA